jgi:hypothetical protein
MKTHVRPFLGFLISSLFLFAVALVLGCGGSDEPKPGARIPKVPPSNRGSEEGGRSGPGKPGDFGKRSENSLHVESGRLRA